jgi:hypothetical protein
MDEKIVKDDVVEYPDRWWYRVYAAVIAKTVLVIAVLWGFSRYFSG